MTIKYDPERQRATHLESGLAVEFVRWGEYRRDEGVYFKLFLDGKNHDFEAYSESGFSKIRDEFPDLDAAERYKKVRELNETNFLVYRSAFRNVMQSYIDFPKIFLETWYRLVCEIGTPNSKKSVFLHPLYKISDGKWSVEG